MATLQILPQLSASPRRDGEKTDGEKEWILLTTRRWTCGVAAAWYLAYVNILNICGCGEMPTIFKTETLFLAPSALFKSLELKQIALPGA